MRLVVTYYTLPHCPGWGPIFRRGEILVTGVVWTDHEISHGQQEMQDLVKVEISALKSDWGALQAHERIGNPGGHKLPIFHWGLGLFS